MAAHPRVERDDGIPRREGNFYKKSEFQFLPPNLLFLTLITPYKDFSSILPHLVKKLPVLPLLNINSI
jgi:hypothetical protein